MSEVGQTRFEQGALEKGRFSARSPLTRKLLPKPEATQDARNSNALLVPNVHLTW